MIQTYNHLNMFNIKLSDLEDFEDNVNKAIDKATWFPIKKWIEDNYRIADLTCVYDDEKSIYKVSSKENVEVKNRNIECLTNGDFIWDIVEKKFDCSDCNFLTTLKGAPRKVEKDFICSRCESLISLEGITSEIGKDFICDGCYNLISFRGLPDKIKGSLICHNCSALQSFEGSPKIVLGSIYCVLCNSLKSLEGSPEEVQGDFVCTFCDSLSSLKGAPKVIRGDFNCSYCNSLKSLRGLNVVKGYIRYESCHNLTDFVGFTKLRKHI